jgi:Zn-dependent peptidase ImmA (M78 family)
MEDNQHDILHDIRLMAEAVHKLDIAVQMILERMEDIEMIPNKEEFLGMVDARHAMILDAAEAQLRQLKKIISEQQKEQFGDDTYPYFGPKGEA